jgi:TRAP-type C4-dicarboxylate transport system permease small subunit
MITKFIDSLARLLFQIAVVGTALMLVVVSANVIARFIFNEPLFWSEEVTAIMIVFVTVFPAALLWRRDWHIKLDMFAGKENTTPYQIKQLFVSLSTIVFSGVLSWQTAKATFLVYVQDMREPSLLGSPLWISYTALLIGSVVLLLAALYSLNATAQRLQKLRR